MKKFSVAEQIIRRPVTVFMVTLMVIGFGLFSLSKLKITLYPPLNIPILAVSAGYPNVAAEDVLKIIVEPMEAALAGTSGLEEMESYSRKGRSFVRLSLKPGTDIRKTELQVRESIDRIRNDIPREAREPVIFQFDPENRPIMRLSVQAPNRGLDELREIAINLIEPQFERIEGVASAETNGGLDRTIYVNVDQEKLALFNLLPQTIENAIRQNNVQIPIGNVNTAEKSLGVRAIAMYTSVEEIEQTIVSTSENGIPVRVRDVAKVTDGFAKINNIVEVNGQNSVTIEIQKQSDSNTLDVTQAVEAAIDPIVAKLPQGVNMTITRNSGTFIEVAVQNLANSAVQALIGVVVILVLFMGGWRVSLIVAMSIPISLTATFAVMYFSGLTLNIFSISGLALAIGMLVDNSIVVSESIAAKMEEGLTRFRAAVDGTNEVIGALVGATLTTLGVFVPLLFLNGRAGVVAKDLAMTICIAISISFIASIILIPVLSSLFMKTTSKEKGGSLFKAMHNLEKAYGRVLNWLLFRFRYSFLAIVLVLIGSFYLFQNIQSGGFPEGDTGELDIDVTLPSGTKLVETAKTLREFADVLMEDPRVVDVVTKIGARRWSTETNIGELAVTLVPEGERESSTDDIALEYRKKLRKPGADIRVDAEGGVRIGGGGWGRGGLRVSLFGQDVQVLQALSDQIEEILLQDPMVVSVNNPRTDPTPELHFNLDRQRMNRMGASFGEIANAFKTQTRGTQVGEFRVDGREIPIEVRTGDDAIRGRDELERVAVYQSGEQRIPVAAVGQFTSYQGINRITRRDREILLDLSVRVKGNQFAFKPKFEEILATQIAWPDGYRYDFTGSSRDRGQDNSEMLIALLVALVLTYMIMASQFENFRDPFVVMFTIPLAFFGSLVLLTVTNTSLFIPAIIGIVLLIGIVVNNGIVLIDYIHQYTKSATDFEDYVTRFIDAAKRRMRPIILTALTTITSMIPLALELGTGSETWSPLARSVIGGLAFSAILSLLIVPSLTYFVSKQRIRLYREYKAKKTA